MISLLSLYNQFGIGISLKRPGLYIGSPDGGRIMYIHVRTREDSRLSTARTATCTGTTRRAMGWKSRL